MKRFKPAENPPHSFEKWKIPAGAGILAGIVVLLLCFLNPHKSFLSVCMLYNLFHLYCPTCGGTRAVYEMIHGNPEASMRMHPLLFTVYLPLLIWSGIAYTAGKKYFFPLVLLVVVMLTFGVVRNLPWTFLDRLRPPPVKKTAVPLKWVPGGPFPFFMPVRMEKQGVTEPSATPRKP